jgi:hypothetical protein
MPTLWIKILNLFAKNRYSWAVYQMLESGHVIVLGNYLDHDKANDGLKRLKKLEPTKRYGLTIASFG